MRLTTLNSPLGLGLTEAPTATGKVRMTFPPSSTASLRSGMLTSTCLATRAVLKSCAAAVEANSAASSREAVRIRFWALIALPGCLTRIPRGRLQAKAYVADGQQVRVISRAGFRG